MLQMKAVRMEFPADANIIVGQSHFIKTVEDLYEAVATTVPQAKFGLALPEDTYFRTKAITMTSVHQLAGVTTEITVEERV